MSKKSKIIVGMIAVIILIATVVITEIVLNLIYFLKIDNSMSKEEISVLVNENKPKLDEIVKEITELDREGIEKKEKHFIRQLNAKRKIDGIYKNVNSNNETEYIEFYCGGKGWDNYCGFYYSPNDLPLILDGKAEDLRPSGDGWYSDANDVWDYTERIAENYFYYEKTFK